MGLESKEDRGSARNSERSRDGGEERGRASWTRKSEEEQRRAMDGEEDQAKVRQNEGKRGRATEIQKRD